MWYLLKLGAVWLFSSIASATIAAFERSRQKPGNPQPFQTPTVSAGTRIPVLFGTWRVRPITTWIGAVKTIKVYRYNPSKIGPFVVGPPQEIFAGYEYGVTLQCVLCWGPVGIANMVFGENRLLTNQPSTQTTPDPTGMSSITIPTVFGAPTTFIDPWFGSVLDLQVYRGGRATQGFYLPTVYGEPGLGGGVKGKITFSMGSRQYGPDPVMEAKLGAGNVPSYGDLATLVYDNLVVGETPVPPPIDYICSGFVNAGPYEPVNSRMIGPAGKQWRVEDMSAAQIFRAALTSTLFGPATPAWMISDGSLDAAHDRLRLEKLGQSMLVGSASGPQINTLQDLRVECERVAGGRFRRNIETFQWEFKLIRNEATTTDEYNALPHYTDDHLSAFEWQDADPKEVPNSITVEFANAERLYQTDTVNAQNAANIAQTKSIRDVKVQYLSVTSSETARQLAARDLKEQGTPLARGKAKATRALWKANLGDAIRVSNTKAEISDRLVRVLSVDLGEPENAQIDITFVEDVFGFDDIVRTSDSTPPVLEYPQIIRPIITAITQTEADGVDPGSRVGSVEIVLLDVEHRVIDVSFKRKSGTDAETAWESVASASPDTSDPFPYGNHVTGGDLNGGYSYDVDLSDEGPSTITYRVQSIAYADPGDPLNVDTIEEITGTLPFRQLPPPPNSHQALIEADPIVWDVTGKLNDTANVTLTASRTLSIVGAVAGFSGVLLVTTSGTWTLALPDNSVVPGSSDPEIMLTPGQTKLRVSFDGARFWWNNEGTSQPAARLQAALAASSALSAALTVGARMSASLSSAASLTANLTTQVRLEAAFSASATLTADLTTGTPVGSHKYWRVQTNQGPSEMSLSAMLFKDDTGSLIATLGGTALESGHSGSQDAAKLFDGTDATYWNSNNASQTWAGYQFATAQKVRQIALQKTASMGGGNPPTDVIIQCSDDGLTWNPVAWAIVGTLTNDTPKWFDFTGIFPTFPRTDFGSHTHWRMRDVTTTGGTWTALSAMLFKDDGSSSIATTGGTALESGHFGSFDSSKLFDSTDATFWESSGIGAASWAGYQFATAKKVMQIALQKTASMDGSSPPIAASFEYSDDGITWAFAGWIVVGPLTNDVPTYYNLAGAL